MVRRKPSGSLVAVAALVLCALVALGSCSFIAVDLGAQSVKVMLMEGKTFDIVLNEQSGRKTDNMLGFTMDDERLIGSPCKSLVRGPSFTALTLQSYTLHLYSCVLRLSSSHSRCCACLYRHRLSLPLLHPSC